MRNHLGPRSGLCVLIWFLVALPCSANPPKPSNSGPAQGKQVNILFTGRLFGYFRLPRLQSFNVPKGSFACPEKGTSERGVWEKSNVSEWGRNLLQTLGATSSDRQRSAEDRVLLGMGDNFALYFPSRIFTDPPPAGNGQGFGRYGKDDYVWNWKKPGWIPSYSKRNKIPPGISKGLREGKGVVGVDNVGCFLSYAGYDAIVPGQHDFYYGPERVRQLARLLASIPANDADGYHPVQMLAANLYIKTSWGEDHEPIPDAEKPKLPFTVGDSDKGAKIKFPGDGDEVLPWLYVETQGALDPSQSLLVVGPEDDPDRLESVLGPSGLVCPSKPPQKWQCWWSSAPGGGSCVSTFQRGPTPGPESNQWRWIPTFHQLEPGNYKACVVQRDPGASPSKPPTLYCHRFTVIAPFLQYQDDAKLQQAGLKLPWGTDPAKYPPVQNPKPFFFKRVCPVNQNKCKDVAVFGVVDPDLPSQVGELNYAWQNFRRERSKHPDEAMKTELAAMDPAKALHQLVQFAEDCYSVSTCRVHYKGPGPADGHSLDQPLSNGANGPNKPFTVLLAQMDPAKAQSLAARLSGKDRFDVIITAANYEQFTRDQIRIVDPTFGPNASGKPAPDPTFAPAESAEPAADPTFVAVPPEAWGAWWMCRPVRDLRVIQDTPAEGQTEYVVSSVGKRGTSANPPGECASTPGNAWQSSNNQALVKAAGLVLPANARHQAMDNPNGCVGQNCSDRWQDWPGSALAELGDLSVGMLNGTKARPKPGWLGDALQPEQQKFVGGTLWALLKRTHADVAMMQKRDFYFQSRLAGCLLGNLLALGYPDAPHPLLGGWNGACGAPNGKLWDKLVAAQPLQKTLDVLLWKGDFLTVLPVRGSVLEQVLEDSDKYEEQQHSSIVTEDQRNRYLVYLGIHRDPDHDIYYVNDLEIDPNRIYTVATTDYIAMADTGYPELNDPSLKYRSNPLYSKRKLAQISTLVCQSIAGKMASHECASAVAPNRYLDELNAVNPPGAGQTWRYRFRDWLPFHPHGGGAAPGKGGESAANGKGKHRQKKPKDLQTTAMEQPHWEVGFLKGSLGFNFLKSSRSESGLQSNFAGATYPGVTSPRSHSWIIDQEGESLWSFRWADFFDTEDFDYNATFTAAPRGPRAASQPTNKLSNELGTRWNVWPVRRKLPHLKLLTSFYFQTQAFPIIQSFSVESSPLPLQFSQGRDFLTLGRVGLGWYNRQSSIEAGVEWGGDHNAIRGFEFFSPQNVLLGTCVPGVGPDTLQKCVLRNPLILPTSRVRILRETRYPGGAFWKMRLVLPLVDRLTASVEDQGEFFFHYHDVNTTDTRLDNLMTSKLSFHVWPNLAFSPTYKVLAYRNQIGESFLLQHSFGITMDYTFTLTNRRVRGTEFRNKQAAPSAQQ